MLQQFLLVVTSLRETRSRIRVPATSPDEQSKHSFVWSVCMINVLETVETIQAQYKSYFYAVIYKCTRIPPRKGVRGRVTVRGIACFKRGFEKESLCCKW
jgi:hypothetical protein